jgi:hypothetical protein
MMTTDENVRDAFQMARRAIAGDPPHDHEGQARAFNRALGDFERAAWSRGWELAFDIADRRERQVAATMVLAVLGKDRGDGEIDLGALGKWYAPEVADGRDLATTTDEEG